MTARQLRQMQRVLRPHHTTLLTQLLHQILERLHQMLRRKPQRQRAHQKRRPAKRLNREPQRPKLRQLLAQRPRV